MNKTATDEGQAQLVRNEDTKTQQVRKSKRLSEKYPEKRIRYDSGTRKYNRRTTKPKSVSLDYQNSLDPLDKVQAEKIINMAGVKMAGKIEDEVEKIVFN